MNPLAGDVFYLRILLHNDHCRGKKRFADLRTVDGIERESYQEVCRLLGLLQDDREWNEVLTDGAGTKMCLALRELFITILIFCMPENPKELFEVHHLEWADDFIKDAMQKGISLNEKQLRTLVLLDIRKRLQSFDRDLKTFRLPEPSVNEISEINFNEVNKLPVVVKEELDFNVNDLLKLANERKAVFTKSQKLVFDEVMEAVNNQDSLYQFIDARVRDRKNLCLECYASSCQM